MSFSPDKISVAPAGENLRLTFIGSDHNERTLVVRPGELEQVIRSFFAGRGKNC